MDLVLGLTELTAGEVLVGVLPDLAHVLRAGFGGPEGEGEVVVVVGGAVAGQGELAGEVVVVFGLYHGVQVGEKDRGLFLHRNNASLILGKSFKCSSTN